MPNYDQVAEAEMEYERNARIRDDMVDWARLIEGEIIAEAPALADWEIELTAPTPAPPPAPATPNDEDITFENRHRLIGRTIRVIYASGHDEFVDTEHVVTDTFRGQEYSAYDGITVGIQPRGHEWTGNRHLWVQEYELLDGEPAPVPATEPDSLTRWWEDRQYDIEGQLNRIRRRHRQWTNDYLRESVYSWAVLDGIEDVDRLHSTPDQRFMTYQLAERMMRWRGDGFLVPSDCPDFFANVRMIETFEAPLMAPMYPRGMAPLITPGDVRRRCGMKIANSGWVTATERNTRALVHSHARNLLSSARRMYRGECGRD